MKLVRSSLCLIASLFLLVLGGCAKTTPPVPAGATNVQPWLIGSVRGWAYRSAHYRICTTVTDAALLARFIRVMEAAHERYAARYPVPSGRDWPLEIDLLRTDQEWRDFTAAVAGAEAEGYLLVGTGGYTLGDRFVCRSGDKAALFSVAAHEGLHQYMARHFRTRLPPSIEEGLATMFETVEVSGDSVRFDFASNPRRQAALARLTADSTIPLDQLLQMNAGDVAGAGELSERYYAQCWALARLWTTDQRYHDGFRRLTSLCAMQRVEALSEPDAGPTAYRPAAVQPLLQQYVAPDWPAFVAAYGQSLTDLSKNP